MLVWYAKVESFSVYIHQLQKYSKVMLVWYAKVESISKEVGS